MILKAVVLDNFYFERVWCSCKDQLLTGFTLGGCVGHVRTDFG